VTGGGYPAGIADALMRVPPPEAVRRAAAGGGAPFPLVPGGLPAEGLEGFLRLGEGERGAAVLKAAGPGGGLALAMGTGPWALWGFGFSGAEARRRALASYPGALRFAYPDQDGYVFSLAGAWTAPDGYSPLPLPLSPPDLREGGPLHGLDDPGRLDFRRYPDLAARYGAGDAGPGPEPTLYWTASAAAKAIGCSRGTFKNWAARPGFPAPRRISAKYMAWRREDVIGYLEGCVSFRPRRGAGKGGA
jgi:predicted DNA-binding transcriptional regulator AlpA